MKGIKRRRRNWRILWSSLGALAVGYLYVNGLTPLVEFLKRDFGSVQAQAKGFFSLQRKEDPCKTYLLEPAKPSATCQ